MELQHFKAALMFLLLANCTKRSQTMPDVLQTGDCVQIASTITETTPQDEAQMDREDAETKKGIDLAKNYCRQVDAYLRRHPKTFRLLVLRPDAADKSKLVWGETSDQATFDKAIEGAKVWSRGGKTILTDCFSQSENGGQPNKVQFYFYPNGALAKSRTVIRTFKSPRAMNGKVILILTSYSDSKGKRLNLDDPSSEGDYEKILDTKTFKKRASFRYLADAGFAYFSTTKVEMLPFHNLLKQAKPKP